MREHQITITLQAEQFQEIQRLARTAGARSVGTFAREKLLATLGLNLGSKNLKATRAQDLTSVTSELKRLHRELQIFIAESLSTKDYGYVVNGNQQTQIEADTVSGAPATGPDNQTTSTEISPQGTLQDYGQSAKDAEDLAERAFIISPRLGAIEEVSDEPTTFSDPLDELLGEFDEAETPVVASSLLSALEVERRPTEDEQQQSNQMSTPETPGGIPHSVYDAELAAFQKEREEIKNVAVAFVSEDAPEEAPAPVPASNTNTHEEDSTKPEEIEETDNSNAGQGIQEESADIDFQNRPPLSGGPPPRKRRT